MEDRMGVEQRAALLTLRQRAIVEYLQRCAQQGQHPTIREIGDACAISSTGMVNYHLGRLVEYGLISREAMVTRGIRLNPILIAPDPRGPALDAARMLLDALDDQAGIGVLHELEDQLQDALKRCGVSIAHPQQRAGTIRGW
jgi:SOS-response transcriptional repressor LexA